MRSKWAAPAPLIAFAVLFTLPWVDVRCNYEFHDDIKRGANRVAGSGQDDPVSQFARVQSGQPANSLAMAMLHEARVPVVVTQSGLQAADGGYTDRGDGTVTLWELSPLAESTDAPSGRR
jgi:hypothetical protein